MATRKQISYGSKGSEVEELQTALNKKGYGLDVDGVFGSKTQAAVKDYQTKNKLQVDGIVGTNTWGSLFPTTTSTKTTTPSATTKKTTTSSKKTTTSSSKNTASSSATKTSMGGIPVSKYSAKDALASVPEFSYKAYAESPVVVAAKEALQAQLNNKPGEYKSSYQQQINDVLDKILNREKFSYDLNGDALYQQYKDQYTTQGKQAMMDTMGQAASLTGGYGNSYAQTVGQQTYQGYLQQLNDKIPELYQLALDQYNREGEDLYNQYGLYADRENTEYGRFRDAATDYYTMLDYLTGQYQNERGFDYGKYTDDRNLAYQTNRDQVSDAMWQTEFGYGQERDKVSDAQMQAQLDYQRLRDQIADTQWQTEFDEALRRWNLANGINPDGTPIATGKSSGGGGGGSKKKNGESETSYTHETDMLDPNEASAAKIDPELGVDESYIKELKKDNNSYSDAVIHLRDLGIDTRLTSVQNLLKKVYNK